MNCDLSASEWWDDCTFARLPDSILDRSGGHQISTHPAGWAAAAAAAADRRPCSGPSLRLRPRRARSLGCRGGRLGSPALQTPLGGARRALRPYRPGRCRDTGPVRCRTPLIIAGRRRRDRCYPERPLASVSSSASAGRAAHLSLQLHIAHRRSPCTVRQRRRYYFILGLFPSLLKKDDISLEEVGGTLNFRCSREQRSEDISAVCPNKKQTFLAQYFHPLCMILRWNKRTMQLKGTVALQYKWHSPQCTQMTTKITYELHHWSTGISENHHSFRKTKEV